MSETRDRWADVEGEAREQVQADLARLESTPLEFGAHIAWSECFMARTNSFSEVHRIGFPQVNRPFTTCGEMIPPPIRWLPVSPAMARTMRRCRYCEAEQERIDKANAA